MHLKIMMEKVIFNYITDGILVFVRHSLALFT